MDAQRAGGRAAVADGRGVDGAYWHLRLANGVLTHATGPTPNPDVGLTMTMTKPQLLLMLTGQGIGTSPS